MDSLRRRIAGQLVHGTRGLVIVTGAGDRWVVEDEVMEPELIGRLDVAECTAVGFDRLKVDGIGEERAEA